jgi:polyisoprenoid-binding protein YceI
MKTTLAGIFMMLLIVTGCKKEHVNTYSINEAQSSIEWKGSSPAAENTGTFSLTGNDLKVKNGKLLNGTFEIPINSLNVTNLPPDLKPVLTNHLLSPDFFNVAVNPLATFKIQKVAAFTGPQKEENVANANAEITGGLTMIGVTKNIQFPARIDIVNNKIQAEASFQIDRTQWGMNYAADPDLGEHHIYPMVKLHVKFVAEEN